MTIHEFVTRLQGVKGHDPQFSARCPAHDDRNASLSVRRADDGRLLVKCHAGCAPEAVVAAMGLTMTDLFPAPAAAAAKPVMHTLKVIAEYDYTDENGKFLARKVKRENKDYSWKRPDGKGGWINNRTGMPRVLYNLPAIKSAETLFIVEGEKDVDTLTAYGMPAVSGADGAGRGKWKPEYTEQLRGKRVVVIPDHDDVGKAFAIETANALVSVAASVKMIDLSKVWSEIPKGGDTTDFAEWAAGEDKGEGGALFKALLDNLVSDAGEHVATEGGEEAETADNWPHIDRNGKPLKHWENTRWMCEAQGISVKYNELTKKIEADYEPYNGLSMDSIITDLRGRGALQGYSLSKADMADHIVRIAEKYSYNPVCDYLTACLKKWDGKSRTRDLFSMFTLGTGTAQAPEFAYTLFEKWLLTAAMMPFNKGKEAAQGVMIVVGPQGIGKTRLLYKLLPFPEWGKTGTMLDLRNKDTVMQALGYWIVELGEYGRTLTAEKSDHYKAFITDSTDEFRVPYARSSQRHPRTTVFYATTDKDEFLHDDAGERRNWVISVSGISDVDIDMGQLWGEVAHMALVEKRPHWLTSEEIDQLNMQSEAHKVRGSEYLMLNDALNWDAPPSEYLWLTATEVCKALGLDEKRAAWIGKALTQLARRGITRDTDTSRRKYTLPPFKRQYPMEHVKMFVRDHKPPDLPIDARGKRWISGNHTTLKPSEIEASSGTIS